MVKLESLKEKNLRDEEMTVDKSLEELPENLRPIKPAQWREACQWIKLRWGRIGWDDDVMLFNDAQFWCEDELWGGIQSLFDKGGEFPPTFAELSKAVMEYRKNHLVHTLAELNRELPAPKGSLDDYLEQIGAESFAHACYLSVQERAKAGKLEKSEDPEAYNGWTDNWSDAKATYMVGLQKRVSNIDQITESL